MRFSVDYAFYVEDRKYTSTYHAGIGFYFSKWSKNKPTKIVYATTNPKCSCLFEKANFIRWCLSKTELTQFEKRNKELKW